MPYLGMSKEAYPAESHHSSAMTVCTLVSLHHGIQFCKMEMIVITEQKVTIEYKAQSLPGKEMGALPPSKGMCQGLSKCAGKAVALPG